MTTRRLSLKALTALGSIVSLSGCFPAMRPSDAGNAAFVRQALPVIQGRRASSYDEVKVLSDMIVALGDDRSARGTVARALMEEDGYVEHWEEVISDQLGVVRSGNDQAYDGCYSDGGAIPPEADSGDLARSMRGMTSPGVDPKLSSVAAGQTMTSVLRSSLRADDLSVAYRAHLFAFASRALPGTDGTAAGEALRRDDFSKKFLSTYVDRNLSCTGCHNSSWSTSGEQTWWDRTWAMPVYFERALFGAHEGEDPRQVGSFFRDDARIGSLGPWGMTACGTFATSVPTDDPMASARFGAAVNPTNPNRSTVWDLDASFRRGVWGLSRDGLNRAVPADCGASCSGCGATHVPAATDFATKRDNARLLLQTRCGECHGESGDWGASLGDAMRWDDQLVRAPAEQPYIVPRNLAASKIWDRVNRLPDAPGRMPRTPRTPFTAAEKATLAAYINGFDSEAECDSCTREVCDGVAREAGGDEAFAFLAGATLADRVFGEVFGKPLTVVNDFPRNKEALQVYGSLANFLVYLNGTRGWSLKETIKVMLQSKLFNRLPPQVADGTHPYELPLLLDPWTEGDPRPYLPPDPLPDPPPMPPPEVMRTPQQLLNAMGEGVHRHSPDTLLRSASFALGWPSPKRFGGGSYPSAAVVDAVGSFVGWSKPGSTTVDFQSLLDWEAVHGACQNPMPGDDWIDQLMTRVSVTYPASHGGDLPTYRQVILAVKDRLVGEPEISDALSDPDDPTSEDRPLVSGGPTTEVERDVLEDHFGTTNLEDEIDPGAIAGLEASVRNLCGALLDSPQFWLAGLPTTGLGEDPELFPSTYQSRCMELAPKLAALGHPVVCGTDSVTAGAMASSVSSRIGLMCPDNVCGVLPWANDGNCTGAPATCIPDPPICDARCADMWCCGSEMSSTRASFQGALYAWFGGMTIVHAKNAQVRTVAKNFAVETAKQGMILKPGDWITLPPGAELKVNNGTTTFTTRPGGVLAKTGPNQSAWSVLVAGLPDMSGFDPLAEVPVPTGFVDKVMDSAYRRWGEGGPRLPKGPNK